MAAVVRLLRGALQNPEPRTMALLTRFQEPKRHVVVT